MVNADLLYTWQEYSVFIKGSTFMNEIVSRHGVWAWMGCFLTQFFYYPWFGSLILIAIWVKSYYLIVNAFNLKGQWSVVALVPFVCFLASIVEVGYWIYYLKQPGYCFRYSLIFLAASFVVWAASKFVKDWAFKNLLLSFFMIGVLFGIGYRFPSFVHFDYSDNSLSIPFYIAAASPLLFAIPFEKIKVSTPISTGVMSALFGLMGTLVNISNVSDNMFHAELRMYKALDEIRYEDVLEEAQSVKGNPTNLMLVYRNIALMHLGQMPEMFKMGNCGVQPSVDKKMNVRIAQISGEMVYYQFGQINYAYRWAIENSVKYGMNFARLKMLIRCSILNGEHDVAYKYITLLKTSIFHRDWALEKEKMLSNPSLMYNDDEFFYIVPMTDDVRNYLDTDAGLCEKWLLDHFSDIRRAANPKLEDVLLCMGLWTEDDFSFLIHFYDYYQNHSNQHIPELYQEALLLFGNMESSPITLNNFPYDDYVRSNYDRFVNDYQSCMQQGLDKKEMGKRMKPLYGNTYWWYYYFYDDFEIY